MSPTRDMGCLTSLPCISQRPRPPSDSSPPLLLGQWRHDLSAEWALLPSTSALQAAGRVRSQDFFDLRVLASLVAGRSHVS